MKKCWIDGKTILITGASSGIGRELAKKFILKNNCHVIGIGRSEEKFLNLIEELGDKKDLFKYELMDVGIEKNWINLKKKLEKENIDIVINNAGILPPFESFNNLNKRVDNILALEKSKDENIFQKEKDIKSFREEIDKTMNVNFYSILYSCKYLTDIIERSETPAIVNISSSSALCPLPGISIYSASKSAVKSFTECLILEKNYYVSLICPGFTKSDIFRYQKNNEENKLVNLVSTNLDKMSYKIYRAICKRKKRCVFGFDAKCMDRLYRLAPRKSPKFFSKVLKKSKIKLFDDVFNDK